MLRFTTAGESHGKALVALVEGLPAGLPVSAEWVDRELVRRMQGYGRGARMKIERDHIEWLSGVRAGETLGSPVAMLIANRDWANWEDVMAHEAADGKPAGEPRREGGRHGVAAAVGVAGGEPGPGQLGEGLAVVVQVDADVGVALQVPALDQRPLGSESVQCAGSIALRIVVDVSPLSHPRTGIGNYIRDSLAGMASASGGSSTALARVTPARVRSPFSTARSSTAR